MKNKNQKKKIEEAVDRFFARVGVQGALGDTSLRRIEIFKIGVAIHRDH